MAERKNLGRGLSALLGEDDEDDIATPVSVAPSSDGAPPGAPDDVDDATPVAAPGGEGDAASSRRGPQMMPIEHLQPGKYQPRHAMSDAELKELAQSIKDKGVLQPLLVRPLSGGGHGDATHEIIAGERRWRASQLAQIHEVPVLVRALDDQETLEVALVENLQRQDLSPLEEADGYRRLMDEFSHTQEVLSDVIGKSRSHVANMLRLLNLPEDVKDMLDDGRLSFGHGRALSGAADPSALAARVVKKGLNVRQTERLVKQEKGGGTGGRSGAGGAAKGAREKDADTRALEHDLGNLLGLSVDIRSHGPKGTITFHYDTLEQLDDLLGRIMSGRPLPASPRPEPVDADTDFDPE